MIRSNLAVLLAESNLKITKVSHDTGISRTTLTALTQNNCKGIQLDTLNNLCTYLRVKPEDIIQYIPIEIKNYTVDCDDFRELLPDFKGTLMFDLYKFEKKYTASFNFYCMYSSFDKEYNGMGTDLDCYDVEILKSDDIYDNKTIIDILKKMPKTFLNDLTQNIIYHMHKICRAHTNYIGNATWTILEESEI